MTSCLWCAGLSNRDERQMLFETSRLIGRVWKPSDKSSFARMNADPKVMEYLGGLRTTDQSDQSVDDQIALTAKGEPAFWATERKSDGAFLEFIGVKSINFDAPFADPAPGYEIGWRLAKDYWGNGYATEGAKAALKYTFETWAMHTIYSFTVPANTPSQAVMRKIGMQRDLGGDFAHPNLHQDHPLSRHVLFRIKRSYFQK